MYITRRQFIGSTAAAAGGAISAIAFSVPQSMVSSEKRVGFMGQTFAFSVYKEEIEKRHKIYTDLVGALNDLRGGKIDYLISSSEYLSLYNPAFSLFGSIPLDPAASEKWKWVQNHYPAVQEYYRGIGLQSQPMGLMHPLALRMSHLSPDELNRWQEFGRQIRMASSAGRAPWFECLGFDVRSGKQYGSLSYQMELIGRKHLDLTEAFSPWAFIPSMEYNIRNRGIAPNTHRGHTVYVDNTSRSGHLIELIQRGSDQNSFAHETAEVTAYLKQMIAGDEAAQIKVFSDFVVAQDLRVHEGLPEPVKQKLQRYKGHYLARVEDQYSTVSHMIQDYRKYEV